MISSPSWRTRLVQWAGAPLARHLYRRSRDRARSTDAWTEAQIQDYHDRALRELVRYAGRHVPFYRRLYQDAAVDVDNFRGLADLHKLPYINRDDLQKHGPEMVDPRAPRWRVGRYDTGGTTTGQIASVYMYRGVNHVEAGFIGALWQRVGVRPGQPMALLRGELSADWDTTWRFEPRHNRLLLSSYQLDLERAREFLDLMRRHRIRWLHAYPSSAVLLASHIERHGLAFDLQLDGLLLGSEMFTEPQVALFERVFRCRVYAHYGHREMCLLAGWCEGSREYHFVPTYGYAEFRPTLVASPAGGRPLMELVGTGYINRLMPLIRYATEDFADPAAKGPCPACGRHHLRVGALYGRGQNFLVAADGRPVPHTNVDVYSYGLAERYQFRQREPGRVTFAFIPADPSRAEEAVRRLQEEFATWRRIGLDVHVEITDDLPLTYTGKEIVVRQELKMPWENRRNPGMARLIERPAEIQSAGNKPKRIEEFVGRVAGGTAALSVARMTSPPGWVEPGQTPEFDEFTVVLEGSLRVETRAGVLDVAAGQAVHVVAGEWVRYSTPGPEGARYVAVCLPAFSPDTVHREV